MRAAEPTREEVAERHARLSRALGLAGHFTGCPGQDDVEAVRLEIFNQEAPLPPVSRMTTDGYKTVIPGMQPCAIVACLECGGRAVYKGMSVDDVLARIAELEEAER